MRSHPFFCMVLSSFVSFVLPLAGQVRPHKERAAYGRLLLKLRRCIEKKTFRTADVELGPRLCGQSPMESFHC
jgi:hypothetical protein